MYILYPAQTPFQLHTLTFDDFVDGFDGEAPDLRVVVGAHFDAGGEEGVEASVVVEVLGEAAEEVEGYEGGAGAVGGVELGDYQLEVEVEGGGLGLRAAVGFLALVLVVAVVVSAVLGLLLDVVLSPLHPFDNVLAATRCVEI